MSLDQSVEELKQQMSTVLNVLDQHSEQLKSHDDQLAQIQARLEVHDDHFAGMFEVMHKQFTRIDERFEKVDERFDRLDERFDRLDDRFLRQELLMEQWRSDCRVFLEGFHSNRERIGDLENRVDRLEFRN